ncbi:MAG TPA: NAD(P)H-dependent glycerol-3-phosphate dehydrogenase [Polyangiaceae bacterium]|nr:NAD(P)H-dependent glycerol-3-phosphate dehydrogenase [Polyangiaceae bacterium]
MDPVVVLGAGAWGTALSRYLAERGATVRLWTHRPEHAAALRADRENREFFPGHALHPGVEPLSDLERAVEGAALVVLVVPTAFERATLEGARAALLPDALIVVANKGIETGSLRLPTEVVGDVLGAESEARVVALSGPSFAEEVARGLPTNLVAASRNASAAARVQSLFASERLRVYTSEDPIGVQVGGALKNVIAIAAGAADGLGFGHNTRAALITRGLAEMARLAVAKGGEALTLAGLSGLGDLVLTCSATLSRNRTVGFELGRGHRLDAVLAALGHVAEGVETARSAHDLGVRLGVDLPITNEVYGVLYEGKRVDEAVRELLMRPPRKEWG